MYPCQIHPKGITNFRRTGDATEPRKTIVASNFIDTFWVRKVDDIIKNIRNLKVWDPAMGKASKGQNSEILLSRE